MGRVPPLRGRGTALRFGGGRSPGCSRAAVQARAVIPLGEHARFFSPCICSRGLDKDLRWRPYHVECTGSLPNSEVKRRRARLVLGWGTAREDLRVLPAFSSVAVMGPDKHAPPCTHLPNPCAHSPINPLTHLPMYPLTHPPTCPFTHLFIYPFTHVPMHPFTHSSNYPVLGVPRGGQFPEKSQKFPTPTPPGPFPPCARAARARMAKSGHLAGAPKLGNAQDSASRRMRPGRLERPTF